MVSGIRDTSQATPEEIMARWLACYDINELRNAFPQHHFSHCHEDEVSPRYRAVLTSENHDLYLVSGGQGHCLEITNDAEIATGFLVASREG